MCGKCGERNFSGWLLIAPTILIGILAAHAAAQNSVGTVSALTGVAHVERSGHTNNVTSGMSVELMDKLATDAGAHMTITLADNSTLDLAESSTLVIDQQVVGPGGRQSTKVGLLGGRLQSLVSGALRGTGPNFEVQTPNAIAGVRGTKFIVTYANSSSVCGNEPSSDVAVATGSVLVANRATPTATVQTDGGYETVVCGNLVPLPPGPLGLAGMGTAPGAVARFSASAPGIAGAPPPVCPVCPACPAGAMMH